MTYSRTDNPDGSVGYTGGPNADGTTTVLVLDANGIYQGLTGTPGELRRAWLRVMAAGGGLTYRPGYPNADRDLPNDWTQFPGFKGTYERALAALTDIRNGA